MLVQVNGYPDAIPFDRTQSNGVFIDHKVH